MQFEELVEYYIHWAEAWDGALPADVFFGVWADFQEASQPIALHARIVDGRLCFDPAPQDVIQVYDNRIHLEDGRELVIELQPA